MVQRGHDRGKIGGLAQALGRFDALPRAEIRVEERCPGRLVLLPLQRVEVEEGMRDARVRPVEVGELAVQPGDVAGMEIAVDECVRNAAGGEAATGVLELRREPPQLRDLLGCQAVDGVGVAQERVDPMLERVEPPVDTAVGEQLARELRRTPLQARIAAKQLLVHVERRVPADEVVELRQQHPAPLGLDGQRHGDVAREPLGEHRGDGPSSTQSGSRADTLK